MAGVEETGTLKHCWQECTAANSLPGSQKVNKNYHMIQKLFSLALHPREMKVNVHTKTCEMTVHRTLFIIAKKVKEAHHLVNG